VARNIHSRLYLRGIFVTQSPLHVGGHGEEVDTDLPLARDGAGQLYVPGTSLAGALRELAERLFGESVIDELWGYQRDDRGHASFVVVDDAAIENSDSVVVEIRDHVGIDREYGAAAEHIKFDRAIIPRGTRLNFHLFVDVATREKRDLALAMLAGLQNALSTGEVRLGAAKTRGLGHIRLENAQLTEKLFSRREGILAVLSQTSTTTIRQADINAALQKHPPRKRPRLVLKIAWEPSGPLMVKAGLEGIAADMLPLVSGCDGQVSLVLPGSSIKGTFRSHAERIVRTLRGEIRPKWLGGPGRQKFLDAVQLPLINELFGTAKQSDTEPDLADTKPRPGLGALAVIDCFGQHRLSVAQWQAIQAATDDRELRKALDDSGLTPWSQAYHVAIDRWLGSAAESMLYTVVEPHRTVWEPLTLELNLQRLPDEWQWPAIALLLLVIRDLANDRMPLGFATHRGMGAVRVNGVTIEAYDLDDDLAHLTQIRLANGKLQNLPNQLQIAWQQWIEQNQEMPA
jgi:CRISPR/Cas system CSM-associated protein Csm3 (group 7 of RAMP superfamily)